MYINHGDVDFFEYGCLVDSEHSDTVLDILYCRPYDDEEDSFFFADCQIDITDDQIEKDAVMSFIGMDENSFDPIEYAVGCINYYGAENFSSPYLGYKFTMEEIKDILKYRLISSDNLNITW